MKENLEKEAEADQEIYEKLACWCNGGEKEKTKAIADAEAHLSDLGATIEKMTALSQTLTAEIEGLEKEIAKNQKSLEVATALRKKQKADFVAEEKEMVQSISALGAAVTVLSKHHGGNAAALLTDKAVMNAMAMAKAQAQRHTVLLTSKQRRVIGTFLQQEPDHYSQKVKVGYQAQSGEIFGILNQMKSTFEANLAASQKEEVEAQQAYEELKVAKEAEIKTGQDSLEDKKQQLANADESLAEAKNDQVDTEASLAADQEYLSELKVKCSQTDKEWEERQKLRNDEIGAVSEAIGILSSDDARDLFSKVYNPPSFLQVTQQPTRRQRVVRLLEQVARQTHTSRLDKLIGSAKLDAFEKVKQAIDDMVTQLLKEKDEEIKNRDLCTSELNDNERTTAKELHEKERTMAKIDTLKTNIRQLNGTINELQMEIADLEQQKKVAGDDRVKEKAEFEAVIADQKSAEALLQQAYDVVSARYSAKKESGASFAQQSPLDSKPPPEGFKEYENKGTEANGVLGLLEHIIQNTKQMQKEASDAEKAAQESYEKFVKDTNDSVDAKNTAILGREKEMLQAEGDLEQAKSELEGTMTDLETLSKTLADLHTSCDFLLKNFEVRQTARDQEVEALRQAKAYLSGMQ